MKKRVTKVKISEDKLKAGARRVSVREGCGHGVMEGFGGRYITPYALALGASSAHVGILSSVPSLLGTLSQLFTLRLMKNISRKKIVIFFVFLQAFFWLPFLGVGALFFLGKISSLVAVYSMIGVYSLMVIFGALAGPAWNSWMKDIVPDHVGTYFGRRSEITGFVAIVSMFFAGWLLDYLQTTDALLAFGVLFFVAFLGRLTSGYYFTRQYEPKYKYEPTNYFSFYQFLKRMPATNFGKFVIFISLISFATAIASPFFAVYMLKDLGMETNIFSYTLITVGSALTSLLFLPVWGKFSDKYGSVKVMKMTGFMIALVPLIWLVSSFFFSGMSTGLLIYLILAEIYSGFCWAGFNLSAGNFIYESVSNGKMAFCVSYFNILNAFAALIGASIGGFLATSTTIFLGLSSILLVFLLSGVLRLILVFLFGNMVKEVRKVEIFNFSESVEKEFEEIGIAGLWHKFGFNVRRIT